MLTEVLPRQQQKHIELVAVDIQQHAVAVLQAPVLDRLVPHAQVVQGARVLVELPVQEDPLQPVQEGLLIPVQVVLGRRVILHLQVSVHMVTPEVVTHMVYSVHTDIITHTQSPLSVPMDIPLHTQ